jgi:hypothetical protein
MPHSSGSKKEHYMPSHRTIQCSSLPMCSCVRHSHTISPTLVSNDRCLSRHRWCKPGCRVTSCSQQTLQHESVVITLSEARTCEWNQRTSMFLKLILTPRGGVRQCITWSVGTHKCLEFLDFSFYQHSVTPARAFSFLQRVSLNLMTGRVRRGGGCNYTTRLKTHPTLHGSCWKAINTSSRHILLWINLREYVRS